MSAAMPVSLAMPSTASALSAKWLKKVRGHVCPLGDRFDRHAVEAVLEHEVDRGELDRPAGVQLLAFAHAGLDGVHCTDTTRSLHTMKRFLL
jgi:hypothetical protein